MLERRINTPSTSSAGRLFDAVASLAGLRDTVSYEGQAAIELEWLASQSPIDGTYPFAVTQSDVPDGGEPASALEIDTRPLICAVARDVQNATDPKRIARQFHSTIVEIIAATCAAIRQRTQIDAVVLSGGVFMNALVASESAARLSSDGFRVYRHVLVPPNDGGLCLGQVAIGAATLAANTPFPNSKASELHAPRRPRSTTNSQKTPENGGAAASQSRKPPSTVASMASESPAHHQTGIPNARQEG
jgi:hydrogenase maturation protein HypF